METLEKREMIETELPEERIKRNLWSARIRFFYNDKTTHEDYIIEDGEGKPVLKLNKIYNKKFEFL